MLICLHQIIKALVIDRIESIIISHKENYFAVCTVYNIYVCVFLDLGHLTTPNYTELPKPKFRMLGKPSPYNTLMRLCLIRLGPITHVTSRPALASAL